MRMPSQKMWLVGGLALVAAACSGGVEAPPVPAASILDPAPAVVAPETPVVSERVLPAAPTDTAMAMPTAPARAATKRAPAQVADASDSPEVSTATAATEAVAAATASEAAPTDAGGPTLEQQQLLASLPSRGPAPELNSDTWLNAEPMRTRSATCAWAAIPPTWQAGRHG